MPSSASVSPISTPESRQSAFGQIAPKAVDRNNFARNAGRQIADPDKHVKEERRKSFEFYRHQLADVTITTTN